MVRILSSLAAFAMAAIAVAAHPSGPPARTPRSAPNDPSRPLYITYPTSSTTWHPEQHVHFNWINAPRGTLRIKLVGASANYTVTDRVGGKHDPFGCELVSPGDTCGRFDWTVPRQVKAGWYTAVVVSNNDGHIVRETDAFHVYPNVL